MTPPARPVVAFTAPDCPAWVDDPTLAYSRAQLREWAELDRATRRAEGRLAEVLAPAEGAKPKGRKDGNSDPSTFFGA